MTTFFKLFNPFIFMMLFFLTSYYLEVNKLNLSNDLAMNIIMQINDLIFSLGLISLYFLLIRINDLLIVNYILIKKMSILLPRFLVQTFNVFIFFIFIIVILNSVYKIPLAGLLATTSVLGVGIAFGMRDILSDIFAGIAIHIEKPFKLNENIELESGLRGEVYDITWRSTFIKTVYNTMISVPNSKMNTMEIINFNRPQKLYKLVSEFYLSYSVPVDKVRRIVLSALESENIYINEDNISVHVVALDIKGVNYLITYLCPDIMSELRIKTKVFSKILLKLNESNLKPSYQKFDINYNSLKEVPFDIEKIDFLRRIDLFNALDDDSLETLCNSLIEHKINEKTILIKEGQKDNDSLYILKEGLLEVFVSEKEKNEEEIMLSKIESGSYFGEFSLLTGKPRSATVKAKTECLIYEINAENIRPILNNNNQFLEHLTNILTNREVNNTNKIENYCLINKDEKEQIKRKILLKIKKVFNK